MNIFEAWCLAALVVAALENRGGGDFGVFLVLSVPFWIVEWLA